MMGRLPTRLVISRPPRYQIFTVVLVCVFVHGCSEFVVSIMSEWFVEAANHTCGNFPSEVDEMAVAGLSPAPSTVVAAPRVKEAAVNMECKVRRQFC